MDLNNPIFIGGTERSGKSILRAFLNSHPNIALPQVGSYMWSYFYGQYGNLGQKKNTERCLQAMLNYKNTAKLDLDLELVLEEFQQGKPTYPRLFSIILVHYAECKGKDRWGDAGVMLERYADIIFEAYSDAKMIHMLRDPRDCFAGSIVRGDKNEGRVGGATVRWLYSMRLAERNIHRYPESYRLLRYEDLVTKPEESIKSICAFLDEEYEPHLLRMEGAQRFRERITIGSQSAPGESPLVNDYIGLYRKKLTTLEVAFIQMLSLWTMRNYGYKLERVRFSIKEFFRYYFLEVPLNLFIMFFWHSSEYLRVKFPRTFGRSPK
jgi:hypothetical protein